MKKRCIQIFGLTYDKREYIHIESNLCIAGIQWTINYVLYEQVVVITGTRGHNLIFRF